MRLLYSFVKKGYNFYYISFLAKFQAKSVFLCPFLHSSHYFFYNNIYNILLQKNKFTIIFYLFLKYSA